MTPRVGTYESIGEKAKRGEYTLVEPLDYMILGFLPDEGTLFAGLYPLGETVPALHKKFDKKVPVTMLSSRMAVLNKQALVEKKASLGTGGGASVWQRTKLGAKLYKTWQESQKPTKNKGGDDGVSSG